MKEVIRSVGSFRRLFFLFSPLTLSRTDFRRCRHRRTQEEFAVKIVSLRQEVDSQNEIESLRMCQGHPNIVRLHEVYTDEVSLIWHVTVLADSTLRS